MNEIRTYYIQHVVTARVTYQRQWCHFSAFINALPWPHAIIKCPLNVHCRIQVKVIGLAGTCLLFFKFYELRQRCTLLAYCFSHTIEVLDFRFCKCL